MTTKNSERQTLVLSTPYKEVAELVRTLVWNKFVFKRPRQLRMEIFDVNGDGKHWWVLAFGFSDADTERAKYFAQGVSATYNKLNQIKSEKSA